MMAVKEEMRMYLAFGDVVKMFPAETVGSGFKAAVNHFFDGKEPNDLTRDAKLIHDMIMAANADGVSEDEALDIIEKYTEQAKRLVSAS